MGENKDNSRKTPPTEPPIVVIQEGFTIKDVTPKEN